MRQGFEYAGHMSRILNLFESSSKPSLRKFWPTADAFLRSVICTLAKNYFFPRWSFAVICVLLVVISSYPHPKLLALARNFFVSLMFGLSYL